MLLEDQFYVGFFHNRKNVFILSDGYDRHGPLPGDLSCAKGCTTTVATSHIAEMSC